MVQGLVDHPEDIVIRETSGNQAMILELRVNPGDLGKVIGRQGRTAKALRTIINAAGLKTDRKMVLEIVDQDIRHSEL